ncbi:hypothetical protein DFH28DRAFT_210269 [Melampsora americana]|nr:hypothetical protein DFH28DRAFT_210269 [Melampsora americana]
MCVLNTRYSILSYSLCFSCFETGWNFFILFSSCFLTQVVSYLFCLVRWLAFTLYYGVR